MLRAYFPGRFGAVWNGDVQGASNVDMASVGVAVGEGEGEGESHPIERLMEAAQKKFDEMAKEEAYSVEEAAKKYRERRGRHPPPGFDAWYTYATSQNAVIVESFFDQIYDDLAPLWGIEALTLRRTAHSFSPKISMRNGIVDAQMKNSYPRLYKTMQMLQGLCEEEGVALPDLNIPINVNDESAMLVPWEKVDTTLQLARPILASPKDVISNFSSIDDAESMGAAFDPEWKDGRERHTSAKWYGPRPFWSLVSPACSPDSPARLEPLMQDIWHREGHTEAEHEAVALLPLGFPKGSLKGYADDWTGAVDVCQRPKLQGLHGAFVAPESMSVTQKLFPLFSATKIGMSNEILIPSPSDWNTSYTTPTTSLSWSEKEDKLYWRGPASGGKNAPGNWQRFHRHRFVAMLNATHVEIAEGLLHAGNESTVGSGYAKNFRLLPGNAYGLATQRGASMAEWVNSWADAAFTDLHCGEHAENGTCSYTKEYFSILPISAATLKQYKYAAVLDGDGDEEGAFLAALGLGRLTLKASIYRQWYDSRVVPWLHFVPLDHTFVDVYGVMEFFRGTRVEEGAKQFAHAHVEMPKHEHHFQTPHSDEDDEETKKEDAYDHVSGAVKRLRRRRKRSETTNDGHDDLARKIAEAGQKWAAKVLRKEDGKIYLYRLLLEYARVVDNGREKLGWVVDVVDVVDVYASGK
ncbi:hypothetical protein P280DRAFT_516172 [Massarina eburnea CBS 473.64]|uniref:Glycosyl transferase CAP10 domain-containing protein n=1 Tax=Massarina eburnea CBS 473.64 TaxID=1395130 RepID=A0A6A6S3B6_9PLEO|nr:hypothetical protein P280DRAFT_516172 [Massarina eburnea CBS 473.64]